MLIVFYSGAALSTPSPRTEGCGCPAALRPTDVICIALSHSGYTAVNEWREGVNASLAPPDHALPRKAVLLIAWRPSL